MGRPREFNEADVVDQAMDVFWRRGYAATSVRDLTEATGIAPSALYRTWGDKHGLFLKTIDRYAQMRAEGFERALGRDGNALEILRAWIVDMVKQISDDPDGKGCLMVNTVAELGVGDPDAVIRARSAFEALRDAIADLIDRGVARGDITRGVDVRATSELLLSTVLGLRIRARAGDAHDCLDEVVDAALAPLAPARRTKRP